MKECFPPPKGPVNPNSRSFAMSSLRLTGLSTDGVGDAQRLSLHSRKSIPIAKFQENPLFEDFLQLGAAAVEGPILSPDTLEPGNLSVNGAVFEKTVFARRQRGRYVP
ncbi:MAG: hypothetical protein HY928_01765 [Elusimicrobia bacterium]|nr:hypothetical protein [Elusimicrobiota bacterium]